MSFPKDAAAQKARLKISAQEDTKSIVKIFPCELEVNIEDGKPDAPEWWTELGWNKENSREENDRIMKATQAARLVKYTSGVEECKYIVRDVDFPTNGDIYINVKVELKEGYHTYGPKEGDGYIHTNLKADLPDGFKIKEIIWPKAKMKKEGDYTLPTYDKTFYIRIIASPPKSAKSGEVFNASINTSFQYCNELGCQLGNANNNFKLKAF